ncbi:Hypothetical predicted protein [Mytilus galloprovincialis]|uniref:Uncharacterized protein n=1 Tax=Mytilus galloprovincialis TaxID=29158 RepID=A0A8B6EY49_MYTGA|nr:Hypothetical predicted protein [Mytilus galloprovincialis]
MRSRPVQIHIRNSLWPIYIFKIKIIFKSLTTGNKHYKFRHLNFDGSESRTRY